MAETTALPDAVPVIPDRLEKFAAGFPVTANRIGSDFSTLRFRCTGVDYRRLGITGSVRSSAASGRNRGCITANSNNSDRTQTGDAAVSGPQPLSDAGKPSIRLLTNWMP